MSKWTIGVIGGSGLYEMEGLEDAETLAIETPWGAPSDALVRGRIGDVTLVFLPRHGKGHRLTPGAVPYRANVDALKRAGCTDVLSISACGSLKQAYAPGEFVMVDQFIDRTFAREKSFFGSGLVAHVSMADPVCSRLGDALQQAATECGIEHARGGTYLAMEGPQFSSRAESFLYRDWGCSVIGMTNMPEAKLAREAELCYATVAMVTDYDCWREGDAHVDVEAVLTILHGNADKAQNLISAVAPKLAGHRSVCNVGCDRALEVALITPPEAREEAMVNRLDAVAGRVLS